MILIAVESENRSVRPIHRQTRTHCPRIVLKDELVCFQNSAGPRLAHDCYSRSQNKRSYAGFPKPAVLCFESRYSFREGLDSPFVRLHRSLLLAAFSHTVRKGQMFGTERNLLSAVSRLLRFENVLTSLRRHW